MKRILFTFLGILFLVPSTSAAKLFPDVLPDNVYFEAISALEQKGVINGFPDGTFRPNDLVSRAATLKIILLSAGVEVSGVTTKNPFPDVPKGEWFASLVKKGRDIGLVQGNKDGNFLPARNVSRAEALAMLFRTNGDELKNPTKSPFTDVPTYAWYAPYFQEAKEAGLIGGTRAQPDQLLTRAQLSDLTYRFFRGDWKVTTTTGKASYYADFFEGRTTANGETFSNAEYTAAHKTLPFGTRVRVTNAESLESIVVRINDRGPYAEGKIIDLTTTGFAHFAPLSQGVVPVELTVVSDTVPLGPAEECEAQKITDTIEKDFYEGIRLFHPLPSTFRMGEVYTIAGEIELDDIPDVVTVFYGEGENQHIFRAETKGKIFSVPVYFPEEGEFLLSVYPGESGQAKAKSIVVKNPPCESPQQSIGSAPRTMFFSVEDGETEMKWTANGNNLFRIQFEQEAKEMTFYVFNSEKLTPPPVALKSFNEGTLTVRLWGAQAEKASLNRVTSWESGGEKTLFAVRRTSREGARLDTMSLTDTFTPGGEITFSGSYKKGSVDTAAVIIDPDENIFEEEMDLSGGVFSGSFQPQKSGSYVIEINREDGLVLFVGSSHTKGVYPLLPDAFELAHTHQEETLAANQRDDVLLAYMNKERRDRNIGILAYDETLASLAQFRADDMCDRSYFSHTDPEGKTAQDYRVVHNVQTEVGENIAKESTVRLAHEGLMRSPAHRKNIIREAYTRVGFGFCYPKGDEDILAVVEIFGGDPFSIENIPQVREDILTEINETRLENPLMPSTTLESVAQQWGNRMAEKDILSFTDGEESLETMLRNAGVNQYARAMLLKIGSISDIAGAFTDPIVSLGDIEQENFLLEEGMKKMGVGIAQNDVWEMYMVIIAAE